MLWLAKFFTKGKSLKDGIKYFHTINGRMPNNMETIKIKNAFMEQNRGSNVIDITSRLKNDWWKQRSEFKRQHPEVAKKIKDEDPYSALLERQGKEIEAIAPPKSSGMQFYTDMANMLKKHRREELELEYDTMFNKILEKAKRIDRDPLPLLEAELGKKLTGKETTTQLLDLFSKRPKKASGGIAGQLHMNRPGYESGLKVYPKIDITQTGSTPAEGIDVSERDITYGGSGLYQGDKAYVGGEYITGNVKVDVQKEGETLFKDTMSKDDLYNLYIGLGQKEGDRVEVGTDRKGNYTFNIVKSFGKGGIAGQLHLNRPGYGGGLLVKLAKLLKGKKKNVWRGFETDYKNILRGDWYPEEFSGRFFTPDKDLAKWYAMRQGTLTGKVKKLKLTEEEIKAAQEFAEKNLDIQYGDDLLVSEELAKKATVDLPATALAKIEAVIRKAKDTKIPKKYKQKDKINVKVPFVKKASGGIAGQLHLNRQGFPFGGSALKAIREAWRANKTWGVGGPPYKPEKTSFNIKEMTKKILGKELTLTDLRKLSESPLAGPQKGRFKEFNQEFKNIKASILKEKMMERKLEAKAMINAANKTVKEAHDEFNTMFGPLKDRKKQHDMAKKITSQMTRESKKSLAEVREGLKEIDIYMGMLQKKGRKLHAKGGRASYTKGGLAHVLGV